jgi:hypothetical protein
MKSAFDSVVDTTIGTITGGRPQDPSHGTPPATGNFIIADGLLGSTFNVTVTFTNPVAYVGFAWGTPDLFNELDVYDGSTPLGSFIGNTSKPPWQPDTGVLFQHFCWLGGGHHSACPE